MKKTNLKNILAISIFALLPWQINAERIIRDSEIESVIDEIVTPLKKAVNIPDLKIYILDNPEINAFTTGANEVFLNTGLISNFPNPDVLRGVLAHEIGHIKGHHVARQMSNITNHGRLSLAGIAVGILGTALSGQGEFLAAGMGISHDMYEKNILKYSRTYESSADQAAFRMLEDTGHSAVGMRDLFKYFLSLQGESNMNPYLLSHPVSSRRLAVTEEFLRNSKYKTSTDNAQFKKRFERMSYKLLAFTVVNPEFLLTKLGKIPDPEIRAYVKSICRMRLGHHMDAIEEIDVLLSKYPNDPYYNELKGNILFDFGKKESFKYFQKSLSYKPDDILMKMNIVISAISIYRYGNEKDKLKQYIPYIKEMIIAEPNSVAPYFYMGQYNQLLGNEAQGQVYLAKFYHLQGDKRAKQFAKSAIKKLDEDSTEYFWAQDIIDSE